MEITNNTRIVPAPAGLLAHAKDQQGGTFTEPIIGFIVSTDDVQPLVLHGDGTISDLWSAERMGFEVHVDGVGFSQRCEWEGV